MTQLQRKNLPVNMFGLHIYKKHLDQLENFLEDIEQRIDDEGYIRKELIYLI